MTDLPPVLRDATSAAFFDAAARGDLLVLSCTCGRISGPDARLCGGCGSSDLTPATASGRGQLVSWCVVHTPPHPALIDAVPYTSAIVELDEGPWLIARLLDVAEPTAGMRVDACFVEVPGGEALPAFTAADTSSAR